MEKLLPIDEDSSYSEKVKKPGHINMVRLFQAEALDLFGAVERGRLLHGTHNRRDSGAPLEVRWREFLQARLPFQFHVTHGYLFDSQSNCTPQIDTMILNSADCHQLMTSTEGSAYAPFTSALAIMEIKNSAYDVSSSLDQLAGVAKSIQNMKTTLRARRGGNGNTLPETISVMLFADSKNAKLEEFREWYGKHIDAVPTYTVLLDRGAIILKRSLLYELSDWDEHVDFNETRNGAIPYLCMPEVIDDNLAGRALLWLYFAIVVHTNFSEGNKGNISEFAKDAAINFKLKDVAKLSDVADWDVLECRRKDD